MDVIETYLANAQTQHDAAAKTSLPNRKDMHRRSAERWEELARGVSDTANRAAVNSAAKAAAAS